MIRKVCVVLQGQLYPEIVNELIDTYKDINDKILSTWNTENSECINRCKENGFNVILQDPPEYLTSANYQVKSLSAGFKKAIDLGYTHAFRCRTDMKISNIGALLNLLEENVPIDKLSFIVMYKNHSTHPEYLTDHVVYGPLDKLLTYWSCYQLPNDDRFIELFLMETYFKKKNIVLEDIKNDVVFFIQLCYENNICIQFTKPSYKNQGNLVHIYYKCNKHPYFKVNVS